MDNITPIVLSVFASTGFWAFVTAAFQFVVKHKSETATGERAERSLLLGLAHDRLYELAGQYIERGFITAEEYDNFMYIYRPYHEAGGNGTGAKIVAEVEKLPLVQQPTADISPNIYT